MQLALVGFGAILVTVYIVMVTTFAPTSDEPVLSGTGSTGDAFKPHETALPSNPTDTHTELPSNPTSDEVPSFLTSDKLPILTAATVNKTTIPENPDDLTMPAYEDNYNINGTLTRDGWVHLPGTLMSAEHWVNLGPKPKNELSEQDIALQKALDALMAKDGWTHTTRSFNGVKYGVGGQTPRDWADFDPVAYWSIYNRLKKMDKLTKDQVDFHRDRGVDARMVYERYRKGEYIVGVGYVNADTGKPDTGWTADKTPVDADGNSAGGRAHLKLLCQHLSQDDEVPDFCSNILV